MTGWLLNTNVLSELRRPRPEPKVLAFIAARPLAELFVSSVTFAEIRYGIARQENTPRRAELTDWLEHSLRPMFKHRVLPITEDVMLRWRLLIDQGRKVGYTFAQPDLIIAATAAQHGLTVVSRNVDDFARAGIALVDPWAAVEGG